MTGQSSGNLFVARFIHGLGILLSPPKLLQDSKISGTRPADHTVTGVLDNYERAIGGREAWKGLTSHVTTGSWKVLESALSGTFEVDELEPTKIYGVARENGALAVLG
jgi:hypothetical protein